MVETCNSLVIRSQVSRQMQVGDACPLPLWDMPIHCHVWVYIIFYEIHIKNCQWKEAPFYLITDLYLNQEPIRLQHVSVKNLNFSLPPSFNIAFRRVQTCYYLFCCFDVKWKVLLKRNFKPTVWLSFIRGIRQWRSTLWRCADSCKIWYWQNTGLGS